MNAVIESEKAALGAAIHDGVAAALVFGALTSDDYLSAEHADAHEAIYRLFAERKSLGAATLLGAGLSPELVGSLLMDHASSSAVEHYIGVVKGESRKRKLIALCAEIRDRAKTSDALELVSEMVARSESIIRDVNGKARRFAECVNDADRMIQESRERAKQYGIPGLTTGVPAIDAATGGIYGPRLVIVAARPGCGKTAILNQIGIMNSMRGLPGFIASLEMGADELVVRAMASLSGKNISGILRGKLSKQDDEAAHNSVAEVGDIPLWLDTDTYSLNGICGQIALAKARHNIAWFAVDHIGLVQTEKFSSRNDQIGHITRTLKQLCKRLGIPGVCLSQLSRASEGERRRPGLHDLRDSGNIEQDADMVIMLHTEATERSSAKRPLQVGVIKNRTGPTGWVNESVFFDGQTQRIFQETAG